MRRWQSSVGFSLLAGCLAILAGCAASVAQIAPLPVHKPSSLVAKVEAASPIVKVAAIERHKLLKRHRHLTVNAAKVRDDDPNWQLARKEVYLPPDKVGDIISQLNGIGHSSYILGHGNYTKPQIALTFDDGPHPEATPKLLKILDEAKVKATFFVVGFMAEKYPQLIKDIASHGHEIGNHSYSHVTLTKLPFEDMLTEYKANNAVIHELTGQRVKYCRPPGGDLNRQVVDAGAELGLKTVLWTDDPGDYDDPGDKILYKRELTRLSNGGIVLLHDGSVNTIDTLAKFIASARAKGYEFVSLDELEASRISQHGMRT